MKKLLARFGLGLVLVPLLTAALVVTVGVPPAHAFACYPPSTINPSCQPQNLPILIESGVISGGGGTGTAIAGGGAGSVAPIALNGGAGALIGGVGTGVVVGINTPGAPTGRGFVRPDGLKDAIIKRDPNWTAPGSIGCTPVEQAAGLVQTGTLPTSTPLTDVVRANTCIPGEPFNFVYKDEYGRNGARTVLVEVVGGVVNLLLGAVTTNACGQLCDWYAYRACDTATTRVTAKITDGGVFQNGAVSLPVTCAGGQTLVAVYVWAAYQNMNTFYMLYNPANSNPNVGGLSGTIRGSVLCQPYDGSASMWESGELNVMGLGAGQALAVPDVLCPPDSLAIETEIDWRPITSPDWSPIVDPIETPNHIKTLPIEYPDCFPAPEGSPCELTLWQRKPGGGLDYCGTNGELCNGWAQSPDAEELYECYFGPYPIDLNKCSSFRYPNIGVLPNTNPDGTTIPYSAPAPSPLPNPITNPNGVPVPIPTVPIPIDPDVDGNPSQCFPSGWGALNPVSWVVMPVQCALRWAFVPRPMTLTTLNAQRSAVLSQTALGQVEGIVTEVTGLFDTEMAGCQGPPMHFEAFDVNETFYPFNACEEPVAGAASAVNSMLTVTVLLLTLLACTRYITGTIGFVGFGASAVHTSQDKAG